MIIAKQQGKHNQNCLIFTVACTEKYAAKRKRLPTEFFICIVIDKKTSSGGLYF